MGVGLVGFEFLEERERGEIGSAKKRKKNLLPLSLRHSKRKKKKYIELFKTASF
jgi:hypothetical protein